MLGSVHESQIAARGVGNDAVSSTPLQARGLDSVGRLRRAMDLHYQNLDPQARELALVTELHRRGLLDQLVAAICNLIITLIGKGGGKMSRRQDNTAQLEQAIQQVTCILDALFSNADGSCSEILGSSANSTNATSTLTNSTISPLEKKLVALGAKLRNGTSITQVVNDMMANNAETAAAAPVSKKADAKKADKKADKKGEKGQEDKHHSAKNAISAAGTKKATAAQKKKHFFELLEARQDSGVQGLLVALRDVVDTILNTLLPIPCPPPGTLNDGMYRSGCPGYGRRDLAVRRSMQDLGERDANILQTMLPMIEMLLRQLPALFQSMAASPASSASGAAATATLVGGAKAASPTNSVDDAFSQIISALSGSGSKSSSSGSKAASSASASAAKAQATGAAADSAASAARSAANLSQNFARDLLNGDGMNLGKRQATGTDDDDGIGSENCDASGHSGGVNVSLLNNLLNGLLSGFSRRREEYVPLEFFKRQTDGTDGTDGDTIGSGNCAASNNTGGINLSLLDNLLNGLLSGFSRRDAGMVPVEVLQRDERADFAPVWQEIKKIGSEHFHIASDLTHATTDTESTASAAKRAASDNDAPDFTPVWEAFRDLVDSGYDQAAANVGAQRRDAGAPFKLDYKPLMKAGINFGKQMFKSFTSGHAKRSADYKPFVDAASNFAATAIKEMFVKSN
ncbi:uncharacterized protein UBRO_20715 [Ustilago bromivora]|uniref:Uncharacterized protein n=1 Tax=Ustilago bromivora TaxID=307758 RepID=A0A1K0G5V2_9BASI|nr:uncharacterized protein UBRO_20715 [Ustilago bromivora]